MNNDFEKTNGEQEQSFAPAEASQNNQEVFNDAPSVPEQSNFPPQNEHHENFNRENSRPEFRNGFNGDPNAFNPSMNGGYRPQNQYQNPQSAYGGYNNSQNGYRYEAPRQQQYGNYQNNGFSPSGVQSGYGYSHQQYQVRETEKKKNGASKGFVVGMVALGMAICLIIGLFSGAALYSELSDNPAGPSGGGSVVIEHEKDDGETPVITDKGNAAYVASVAADTVVEVTTETVSTDSFFGNYVTQGAGSGVIISSGDAGTYIITCAHVIEGATKVTVRLKDGTEYESVFSAGDSQTDIGIIKIDVKGLSVATIGDFSKVVVGEEVIAIGNPLGELGGSVTNGIVSALDRDIIIDGTTYHLLQTNAEINPGNSGGGLFNAEGKLIGIVNAKSSGENVEGLGFAIPIDEAEKIATELIENGYVTGRVKLGISVIDVQSQEDAAYWWNYSRFFTGYGVYIIESENEGFLQGDKLVAVNSFEIKTSSELKGLLLDFEVGETVTVTVSRLNSSGKSEMIDVEITLQEMTNEK